MKKVQLLFLATALAVTPAIVQPMEVNAHTNTFSDVSPSNSYYDVIHEMRDAGIITGYPDGTFKPNQTINRKQAAALLNRAKALPVVKGNVSMNDVKSNHPNYQDILAVQRAGIFEMDSKGNFNPNKEVTRAEMARALVVAFDLKATKLVTFSDVPKNTPLYNDVSVLLANNITTGDNGKFLPNKTLTRAHYAVFMHRAMGLTLNDSESKNLTAETLPTYIKNNPSIFTDDVKTYDSLFTRTDIETLRALLTTDKALIEKLGLKFTLVGGALGLEENGYKGNPRPGYNTVEQITISRANTGAYQLTFDFRSGTMEKVIPELVKYFADGYDLTAEIQNAIAQARLVEKGKGLDDFVVRENDNYMVKINNINASKAVTSIVITPK